jgi:hypothetical protein
VLLLLRWLLVVDGWPRQQVVAARPRRLVVAGKRLAVAAARVARGERLAGPRVLVVVVVEVGQQALVVVGLMMMTPLVMPWTTEDERVACSQCAKPLARLARRAALEALDLGCYMLSAWW